MLISIKRTLFVILFGLCAVLPACTISVNCILFNNSSASIEIIRSNNKEQERYVVQPGQGVELANWTPSGGYDSWLNPQLYK